MIKLSLRNFCHFTFSLGFWFFLDGGLEVSQGGMSESCSVRSDSLLSHGPYSSWNSPGQNTGVGSLTLLQGIFPIQESNPGFLQGGSILYQLSHKGSPRMLEWVAYPFLSRSSPPRNRTGVSCIAGGFFTNGAIREEYWSGLPFPPPGDLPNPGTELVSPSLAGVFFTHWVTKEALFRDSLLFKNVAFNLLKLKVWNHT